MKRRHKRIIFIVCCIAALGLAIALVLTALNNNLQFFLTPTEVAAKQGTSDRTIRVGGLVETGSIQRQGTLTRFTITDTAHKVPVVYNGITPDLFKDGRGCVVVGKMGSDGVFHADTVMAKHDENYMPPEAGQAIDKAKASKTLVEK
jgi:cytochrome c-type biogenesis protein CcmE